MMTMETYTGLLVDPLDISMSQIRIEDIAHALSLQCRYNGHCKEFYSVAQHSVQVCDFLDFGNPRIRLFGLLHDAAEAYLGDMIKPLKEEIPLYKEYEYILQDRIFLTLCNFCSPCPGEKEVIKIIDTRMLITEAQSLMPSGGKDWAIQAESIPGLRIEGMDPNEAETLFLSAFKDLKRKIGR